MLRVRLWLALADLAERLRAPHWLWLALIVRASAATDWGSPIEASGEEPF